TLVRVTGSPAALSTSRSYSTWSLPSSPRTTCASWIGLTEIAVASGFSLRSAATALADIARDAARMVTCAAIHACRKVDRKVMVRNALGRGRELDDVVLERQLDLSWPRRRLDTEPRREPAVRDGEALEHVRHVLGREHLARATELEVEMRGQRVA